MKVQTRIKLKITAKDIATGRKRSPSNCPTAKALKRLFPKSKKIDVSGGDYLFFESDGYSFDYVEIPVGKGRARVYTLDTFICDFDNNKPVKPLTVELELRTLEIL